MKPTPLILASASPRRRQLLRALRIPFRVIPSRIQETSRFKNPRQFARDLAKQKALSVAKGLENGWVLGADTIVVLGGKILGKPRDPKHAYAMLKALGGSRHHVYTAVALVDAASGRLVSGVEGSTVRMRALDHRTLEKLSKRHHDKAGAYAIQEKRDPIARVVQGSYDNVVGLPVGLVRRLISRVKRLPAGARCRGA